jgi:predicted lysophospholipase L1 biosynthesis ABC-type transport system permease subunit
LWPGVDPVGQILRVEPDVSRLDQVEGGRNINRSNNPLLASRSVAVVGVATDVAGIRLGGTRVGAVGVYMPINVDVPATVLTMSVRGDADRARQVIVDRLAAVNPNAGEVSALRTIARTEVYLLGIPFWLTLVLGTLALLLTLSGLFSVLSYLVERRTKEIGVRMALGATGRSIGALVLTQSARPVGIGILIGVALTSALAAVLLATPAAEAIGSTVRLFDPLAYAGSLLVIVAACAGATLIPALRAGRINPVIALRQD